MTAAANDCRNCGTPLLDAYCHVCGQKRFADSDRRLAHLLGEFFRELTSLDGRLWRSLRLLLFHPGRASREYLDGRRARYYSPIGLFVLANVLYFFAPALSDFNLPFTDQVPGAIALRMQDPAAPFPPATIERLLQRRGQLHSAWTAPLVEPTLRRKADAADVDYTMRNLADDYDDQAGDVGKALMIVHVPILALALLLANVRRRMYFAEHFVVALHLFTFLLLFMQIVLWPAHWLLRTTQVALPEWLATTLVLLAGGVVLAYIARTSQIAYRGGWLTAIAGLSAVLVGLWLGNLWVYRALQFVITLWLI